MTRDEFIFSAPRAAGSGEYGPVKVVDVLNIQRDDDGEPIWHNGLYGYVGQLRHEAWTWEFVARYPETPFAESIFVMEDNLRAAKASIIRQVNA